MFKPFEDAQLAELEDRLGPIYVYTPEPRAASRWAKPDPDPKPPFSLVFRACVGAEWANIMGQANDPKRVADAPRNLCLATIAGVSLDGEHILHTGSPGGAPNDREASKGPRAVLEKLLARPGCTGIPQAVSDALTKLNGAASTDSEKG